MITGYLQSTKNRRYSESRHSPTQIANYIKCCVYFSGKLHYRLVKIQLTA